jgi:hypothetical protein
MISAREFQSQTTAGQVRALDNADSRLSEGKYNQMHPRLKEGLALTSTSLRVACNDLHDFVVYEAFRIV